MSDKLRLTPLHEGLLLAVSVVAVAVLFTVQDGLYAWGELLRSAWPALLAAGLAGVAQGFVEATRGRPSGLSLVLRFFSLVLVFYLARQVGRDLDLSLWADGVILAAYFVPAFAAWVAAADPDTRGA